MYFDDWGKGESKVFDTKGTPITLEKVQEVLDRLLNQGAKRSMSPADYIRLTGNTDRKSYADVQGRLSTEENAKLFHFFVGIATESGELLDAIKKSIIYGKTLDKVNLKEELGDVMWYVARACAVLDVSLEEVMEVNIKKLAARYPDKFTEEAALVRDLDKERQILEGKV